MKCRVGKQSQIHEANDKVYYYIYDCSTCRKTHLETHNTNLVGFVCVQFDGGVRQHPVHRHELHATPPHQVHVVVRTPLEKHTAPHRRQHGAESQVRTCSTPAPPPSPRQFSSLTGPSFLAAPPPGAPPPPRLHTVLAPRRRTASPAAPPAAAPSTELSSETGAAPPTTAPRRRPRCPTTRGLSPSSAGAPPPGSSAKSPPSLSAGQ